MCTYGLTRICKICMHNMRTAPLKSKLPPLVVLLLARRESRLERRESRLVRLVSRLARTIDM